MRYADFEQLISVPRMSRYLLASGNSTKKAMTLYRANSRLSQKMYAVLGLFEIVLRNKIDQHYSISLFPSTGTTEWLVSAINPGGYLTAHGCGKSLNSVQKAFAELTTGSGYTHDKLIAELMFGFWRFQFASKEFMAAGSTLHTIFTNRPYGTNHTDIFKKLTDINKLRNRISHHEPICFDPTGCMISTKYALNHYNLIRELLIWLNVDADGLLYGIDNINTEIVFINSL